MRYPKLVREKDCNTPILVNITDEGLSEDGAPIVLFEKELMCNYQDTAKTVLTTDKKLVQISGSALFTGDIAPDLAVISAGTVTVHGVNRRILQGQKARNPDGSVNYTRLDVI